MLPGMKLAVTCRMLPGSHYPFYYTGKKPEIQGKKKVKKAGKKCYNVEKSKRINHLQVDLAVSHWQSMAEAVQSMQRILMEKKERVEWQRAIWDRPEKEVPA